MFKEYQASWYNKRSKREQTEVWKWTSTFKSCAKIPVYQFSDSVNSCWAPIQKTSSIKYTRTCRSKRKQTQLWEWTATFNFCAKIPVLQLFCEFMLSVSTRHPACNIYVLYFIAISGLSGSTIFFSHYLTNSKIFGEKITDRRMCVLTPSTAFVRNISHSKKNSERRYHKKCIGLHVQYPLFMSGFNQSEFSWHIFEKYWNMKFHGNPSSESRVVQRGRTNRHDRQ